MATPSLAETIRLTVAKAVLALQTAMPGRVISYSATTQTADVQPLLRWAQFLPGRVRSVVDLPVLPDVLVCYPRGADKGIHYPLEAGDLVLLVFCSRSLTSWRGQAAGGTITDPARVFTPTPLESAIALPLMTHDSAPLTGDLVTQETINLGRTGLAPEGSLFDFVAKANKVLTELQAIVNVFNTHTHTGVTSGAGTSGVPSPATLMPSPSSVNADDVRVS